MFLYSPRKPLALQQAAPGFSRLDHHSETIYSERLLQQGGVLLHFYTSPIDKKSKTDLSRLKELYPDLHGMNLRILAMNPFDWEIQHRLAKHLELPYSLLYDPLSKTAREYGAAWIRTFFNYKLTYIIPPDGLIAYAQVGGIEPESLLLSAKRVMGKQPQPVQ